MELNFVKLKELSETKEPLKYKKYRRPNKNKKKNPISKLCFYQITEHPELGYFKTKEEARQKLDEIKLNEKE